MQEINEKDLDFEILNRLNVNLTGKATTGNIMVSCPLHKDNSPSMSVSFDKHICHCFSCQWSGTLKSLYYEITGHSIMKDLGIKYSSATSLFRRPKIELKSLSELPETSVTFEGNTISIEKSEDALKYLAKRGITIQVANNMRMRYVKNGYTKDSKNLSDESQWIYVTDRLMTPVYENGKILSYELRDVKGEKAFYENMKEKAKENATYKKVLYPKKSSTSTLFQIDHLDTTKPLYFLEGLMDLGVLRADPYFKNSTSVFGASIGQRQQYLLKKFPELIYIADHDKAGLISILKLKEAGLKFKYIFAPRDCKDVGDIPQVLHLTVEQCRQRNWLNTMKSSDNFDIIKEAEASQFVSPEDVSIIKQAYKERR